MGEKLESLGSPADYSVTVIPSEDERKAGRKVGWKQRMQHSSKECLARPLGSTRQSCPSQEAMSPKIRPDIVLLPL